MIFKKINIIFYLLQNNCHIFYQIFIFIANNKTSKYRTRKAGGFQEALINVKISRLSLLYLYGKTILFNHYHLQKRRFFMVK